MADLAKGSRSCFKRFPDIDRMLFMGLLDIFKKKEDRSAPQQAQLQLAADEVLEQGKAYATQGDMDAAFKAYLQAAEMGNIKAMHKVGQTYLFKHQGAPFDLEKSAEWHEKAAKGGNVPSMMMLSQCYLAGAGVPESDEIAKQWMERAVEESKRTGEARMGEIATERLNDMARAKQSMQVLYSVATQMEGIPPPK